MLISKLASSCGQLLAKNGANSCDKLLLFKNGANSCDKMVFRLYTGGATALPNHEDSFNTLENVDIKAYKSQYGKPQEAWIETLDSVEGDRLGLKALHQDVFAVYPRVDIIHQNVKWQRTYNKIDYNHVLNVKEMIAKYGGGGKPWPQKGTGRARHGSIRSPQWVDGGKVFGPKAPKSHYYMLPRHLRIYGLTHTLTIKYIQDDIHVVDNLDIPTDEPSFLTDLIKTRGWGKSTLFIDTGDFFPTNITSATDDIQHVNLMPVYGLNVISMLKHETLVLTERAVDEITKKLIFALNRTDQDAKIKFNYTGPKEIQLNLEQYRPIV